MDRPAGRPQPIQASPAFPTIPLSSVLRCRSVPHGLPLPHSLRAVMSHSGAMDCPPGSARFPRHLSPSSPPKRPSMSCGVPALHLACTLPPTPPSVPSPLPPSWPNCPSRLGRGPPLLGPIGPAFRQLVRWPFQISRFQMLHLPPSPDTRRPRDVCPCPRRVHALVPASLPLSLSLLLHNCKTAQLHNLSSCCSPSVEVPT